jgi:predicted 3-demethylubiquinone-9 3-methyltransferase (glyoxalase superfamily)
MPICASKINPCLWFDTEAEEAARFYCSIFKNSKVGTISSYGREGKGNSRQRGGIGDGGRVRAGRPEICRTERRPAIQVQRGDLVSDPLRRPEGSRLFLGLTDGGEEGPCGWLKDRYGLSWQVVPKILFEMLVDRDQAKSQRVTKAFPQMKKFDIAAPERAYAGRN